MADKYITKAELRIDPYNINHEKVDDKYLETLQDMTYDLINSVCNQSFEPEGTDSVPVIKKLDGSDKDTVFLPTRLLTLKKVYLYYGAGQAEAYEYEPENFVFRPKYISWVDYGLQHARVLVPEGIFPKGNQNIGISGIWGYAECPSPIKYVQGRLIEKIIEDKSFAQKFQKESIGDYSFELRRNLQANEEEITGDFELDRIIKQYRNWLYYGSQY